eukprot:1143253-Pelagomonas_calceolata.AAC.3
MLSVRPTLLILRCVYQQGDATSSRMQNRILRVSWYMSPVSGVDQQVLSASPPPTQANSQSPPLPLAPHTGFEEEQEGWVWVDDGGGRQHGLQGVAQRHLQEWSGMPS